MNDEMVILRSLSIGYRQKDNERRVAEGLNAALRCGQLTCLLGANGIGKSTLLRTLTGFQPPLGGDIELCGRSIADYTDRELSHTVGIVLTEKPDVQNMTVEEMVAMGRQPYTGFWGTLDSDDRRLVDEAIRLTGIDGLRGRLMHRLSDGERQKVMIAKTLAQQTPVIFLDEPTAFLDFPSKVEMMQLLSRMARQQQKTVLLSTHDVELALQVADCIWLMEPGQLSVGSPRQLADDGALSRFIERPGIVLDRQALTIRINQQPNRL